MMNYNVLGYLLKNMHTDITIEKLSADLDISTSTCARLIDYKNPYKRPPNSLKSDAYAIVFKQYRKEYFLNNNQNMISHIMNTLNTLNIVVDESLSEIHQKPVISDEEFNQFVSLLIHQASLFYRSDEQMIETNTKTVKVQFNSYFDLLKKGITAMDIAHQVMANDAILYEHWGEHVGTPQQWCDHIIATPENWGFLCEGTKIVGNWSFIFLSKEQERAVKSGNYIERDFTLEKTPETFEAQREESAIYLLNMSLNNGYQTKENQVILWKEFGKRLQQLASLGIFYKGIYTVERTEHQLIYDEMGFRFVIDNSYRGKVYYLDLMSDFPQQLSWIMPNTDFEKQYDNYWGNHVVFKKLSHKDILTDQQLSDISSLIWDCDRYIYPAMMTRQQMKRILPILFASNRDVMFSLDNLFVAIVGRRIIGLILFKKGLLNWTSEQLRNTAFFLGEELPYTLDKVEKEYFTRYNIDDKTTFITNSYIHSNYRLYDISMETKMMEEFIKQHPERLGLYVLQETIQELRVYLRNGFEIVDVINGFSVDNHDLPCAYTVREPK